jgi:hypothetical protein
MVAAVDHQFRRQYLAFEPATQRAAKVATARLYIRLTGH